MQSRFETSLRVFIWVGCVVISTLGTVLAVQTAIGSAIRSMAPSAPEAVVDLADRQPSQTPAEDHLARGR
ncbi:MAG: hypothetical protein ACOCXX_02975 [Planctomycetota bacterium]